MDLSVHTIVVRNRISKPEAEQICRLYGKSLSNNVEISGSDIKIAGINQINLKGMKIPSISDFADEKKGDGYQKYAAYTSAQFARYLIESVLPYINR